VTISVFIFPSVCPSAWNNSAPTSRNFIKFDIWSFFENLEKIQVWLQYNKNIGYFTWRRMDIFYNISLNSSQNEKCFRRSCRENQNTRFMGNIFVFQKSYHLWDNVEKYGRARQATDDNKLPRMRFAWWITKTTDTHSEYVILIAFPHQQWLRESASLLRYMYMAFLLKCISCVFYRIAVSDLIRPSRILIKCYSLNK
jgi:hypothetical protein